MFGRGLARREIAEGFPAMVGLCRSFGSQGLMRHRHSQLLVICLAIFFTIQFLGIAPGDDRLCNWFGGTFASDQFPGETNGLTEIVIGEEAAELEFAPVQGSSLHVTVRVRSWVADSWLCPRETFDSDLFRPPTATLA